MQPHHGAREKNIVDPDERPGYAPLSQRFRQARRLQRAVVRCYMHECDVVAVDTFESDFIAFAVGLDEIDGHMSREAGRVVIAVAARLSMPVGPRQHDDGIEGREKRKRHRNKFFEARYHRTRDFALSQLHHPSKAVDPDGAVAGAEPGLEALDREWRRAFLTSYYSAPIACLFP